MKRILTIQDISCLGKCSVTVALPILSAMGVETAVLPTAVLSTHTAFPQPEIYDLTHKMQPIAEHWQRIGARFDGMYTGYLASADQVAAVQTLADMFQPDMLLVDPAMADHGKLYAGFDRAFVEKMKALCARGDVILPNLTEACLLTDTPYREAPEDDFIKTLLHKLLALGCGCAVITGVAFAPGMTGAVGCKDGAYVICSAPQLPISCHGTGDVFASVCAGALVSGQTLEQALSLAVDFTAECVKVTAESSRDSRFGVCFEPVLPHLWSERKS